MAESFSDPNREISDAQKETFAKAVERLDYGIFLAAPSPEELLTIEERYDNEITIPKIGHFAMNGDHYELEVSETLEEVEGKWQASMLWAVRVKSTVGTEKDAKFTNESLYFVLQTDGDWEAEYEAHARSYESYGRSPIYCLSDEEIERRIFWQNNPSVEAKEARFEILNKEMEENESSLPLEMRFTQQRMSHILALLLKLKQEHLVEPRKA